MPAQSAKNAILAVLLAVLTACASTPPSSRRGSSVEVRSLPDEQTDMASANPAAANDVLFQAISLVGTPYRYGGNSPEIGFDCSGLIGYVFLQSAGLKLPRSTAALIDINAPKVEQDRLIPGDLVYFNTLGGRVSHIGIYVGERRFVHAPSSGGFVRMDNLDTPYWQKHYVEAKRILADE